MFTPPPGPSNPAVTVFPRRHGSIRRTTSISTVWPEGHGNPMLMTGEARDLLTRADGTAQVAANAFFEILASQRREIISIKTQPDFPSLQGLVGQRAGANLRLAIGAAIPGEKAAGSPLYQLLDDFCGASLVAPWPWSEWDREWMLSATLNLGRGGRMEGVCFGFAPGSSSLDAEGNSSTIAGNPTRVPEITDPQDPLGWHEMVAQSGPAARRVRRIDVWREPDGLHADAHFQDNATSPKGGRIAVHEYLLRLRADAQDFTLLGLEAEPRILPYPECPGAAPLASIMLGQKIPDFRLSVLETMPGTKGCTHLNDMLRAMADMPALSASLPALG